MPLLPHIRLILPSDSKNPSAGKLESLSWVRARLSYHRFPWKEEQEEGKRFTPPHECQRGLDVLSFELHPKHVQLAKRARQAYESHRHERHTTFVGRALMPALASASPPVAPASASAFASASASAAAASGESISGGSKTAAWANFRGYLSLVLYSYPHIVGLDRLITIEGSGENHDAIVGCGLMDRDNHLQGVVASAWAEKYDNSWTWKRSLAVRAAAFFALMQEEEKDASRVKVCVNPLVEAQRENNQIENKPNRGKKIQQ
jgi:hypothetical protein